MTVCAHYNRIPSIDPRYEICARCHTEFRRPGVEAPTPPTGYKPTSREAYRHSGGSSIVRDRIEALFEELGSMTDEQLFDAYRDRYGGLRNTVLPSRNALYQDGRVVNSGHRATVRSGRTAIVWSLASHDVPRPAATNAQQLVGRRS